MKGEPVTINLASLKSEARSCRNGSASIRLLKVASDVHVARRSNETGDNMFLLNRMYQAISEKIISESEAREIHRIVLIAGDFDVEMPEHLNLAMERFLLWEMDASETMH